MSLYDGSGTTHTKHRKEHVPASNWTHGYYGYVRVLHPRGVRKLQVGAPHPTSLNN